MSEFRVRTSLLALAGMLLAAGLPGRVAAQLVGDDAPPSGLQPAAPGPAPAAKTADGKPATPAAPGATILTKSFTLEGGTIWTETGITLEAGQKIEVKAEGKLHYGDAKEDNGPNGLARNFKDLIRSLPVNSSGRGALIGRIGDADAAQAFLIGESKEVVAPISGKLALGINQTSNDTGEGSYKVSVTVYASTDTTPREVAKQVSAIPGVDAALFEKIPRRIGDKEGNPGDMVNFLILGNEDQMKKVFTTAGWVKVDANVQASILGGVLASMSKEAYLTMPMSQLYLFGRPQDYGWAHAEPVMVVASRHHLRVWKAPFTVNGVMVWVGAATHDIGFEKDQRNGSVTHKIDPDIDQEKDYVEKTLSSTGVVSEVTHFTPPNALKEAKTATGGSFHSNGAVLILKLAPATGTTSGGTSNSTK